MSGIVVPRRPPLLQYSSTATSFFPRSFFSVLFLRQCMLNVSSPILNFIRHVSGILPFRLQNGSDEPFLALFENWPIMLI